MKKRKLYAKLLTAFLCTILLYGCGGETQINTDSQVGKSQDLVIISDTDAEINEKVTYDDDDFYSDWKNENPNYIELKGTVVDSIGTGVEMKEDTITITKAGVYALSGKLDKGQIIVDEQDKGTVKLVLNGVEIHATDSAPIYVKKAGKTIITLEDGTENMISDGENYVFEDDTTDEPNAAIFSKDNLTINGTGKLTVYGNYNNGISSKDDLKITGGQINIYSADDGLMGRDLVAVKDGTITIKSAGDGIKSSKGLIVLEGGIFNIEAGADGIQGETAVYISGGDYSIFAGGGSANGSDRTDTMGNWEKNNTVVNTEQETGTKSTKGIKASTLIAIEGGTFNLDTSDDAIHSDDSIIITDGDIIIATGDDGIHADKSIIINGGKINITESYEGIESAEITITGGEIYVTASDDGINISDGTTMNGRPGQNNFSISENSKLTINGGYIVVNASGDGLDSNGSIYMTDGIVIVNGPTHSRDGALDFDGIFEISGGILIAAGSTGMAQTPSNTSTQYSISMNFSSVQEANTLVHLQDSEGNAIVTFAPEKDFQNIVISSPELEKDGSYTFYTGGDMTDSNSDGLHTGDSYRNGTEIVSFTISDIVTWLSETGITTGNQQRGFQMQGGGRDRMNQEGFPNQRRVPNREVNPEQNL